MKHIENSTLNDIDEIFRLYGLAADHQRSIGGVVVWPTFERTMVIEEITTNHQWNIKIDGRIACVWATTFSDEQIWEQRNVDAAVYIHRIATNPDFRGHHFVATIVEWAKTFARKNNKDYIRLDTLGENKALIAYYQRMGFDFLGMFDLQDTSDLPAHYHNERAALFEIKL